MAREIELRVWCDPCMDIDGERVEAEEMPQIIIGRAKPKVIAMCPQHKEDFWDPFVEAIQKMAEPVDSLASSERVRRSPVKGDSAVKDTGSTYPHRNLPGSPTDGTGLKCPVETCEQHGLKHIKSLQSHLRTVHGQNLFEVIGKDGQLFHDNGTPLTPMPEIRAYKSRGKTEEDAA